MVGWLHLRSAKLHPSYPKFNSIYWEISDTYSPCRLLTLIHEQSIKEDEDHCEVSSLTFCSFSYHVYVHLSVLKMQGPGARSSPHPQLRAKPGSITHSGPVAQRSQRSREPSRHRPDDAAPNGQLSTDNETDRSAELLIRRVLCPVSQTSFLQGRPLHELLPPLTSQNEVDVQLYAIIAIVIRDFVYSWYGKITPDQTFVEETIRIVAHFLI